MTMSEIDVHATGVLSELQAVGRCLDPTWPGRYRGPHRLPQGESGWRRKALPHFWQRLLRAVKRRNAWHGYHAEPRVMPPGVKRIGTGWTRRRALRDLERHIAEAAR
jgi:hypothetical protein